MDDPVLRRQLSDGRMRNTARYYAALMQKGGHEAYIEKKRDIREVYRVDPNVQFARNMRQWLLRTSYVREAFNWKTHLPMVYPERVRKTCNTCLSFFHPGARLW
jgi:hypothetical protein